MEILSNNQCHLLNSLAVGKVTKSELVKTEVKSEPPDNYSDMSAYYSDDNSDDDFQPNKRKKVHAWRSLKFSLSAIRI